nr:MAG TPA: hypothetical protein [Caudoviricetes sp.]
MLAKSRKVSDEKANKEIGKKLEKYFKSEISLPI